MHNCLQNTALSLMSTDFMSFEIVIIFESLTTFITADSQGNLMNTDFMNSKIAVLFHSFTTLSIGESNALCCLLPSFLINSHFSYSLTTFFTIGCHISLMTSDFVPFKIYIYFDHSPHFLK